MQPPLNEKYNVIMPESTDQAVCVMIDRLISDGYSENFVPRLSKMLKEHGEIRVLIYFSHFQGWEEDAAKHDMQAFAEYAKNFKKLALVNPPESEVFRRLLKQGSSEGELKLFNEADLQKGIEWVKS